ncbi:MAG: hypothetical protein CVU73_15435 [Deltaproteobacteria bacterium HGW-Deltaproteobacteria-8]|jgi:Co/Zn/Cd efflux system component|nr:MAG: hypothetical protein CVU73_15435 [Deltaproteobacteria bacterium HGW-Deltaproteobacteria-8]
MDAKLNLVLVLLASPLAVFALNILVHALFRAFGMPFVAQKTVFLCALAGNVPVFAAAWWFSLRHVADPLELAFGLAFVFCLHNALGCFYYQCFSLSETSLHIHALTEVYLGRNRDETPGAGVNTGVQASKEVALEADEAVAVRLNRLLELGQVCKDGNRYLLTGGIFLHVSRLFDFWRWLIGCSAPEPGKRP